MDNNTLFLAINKNFENYFSRAYKSVKKVRRNTLLKYMISYYRRWYYSALIEDTLLTPANLSDAVHNLLNSQNTASQASAECVSQAPRLGSYNRLSKMSFVTNHYTLDEHPVVNDLWLMLDGCRPDFELDEDDCLTEEHRLSLIPNVSISDPYYLDYLLLIATGLGLVDKIPSIHSNRAQVTQKAGEFFALSPREQLTRVVDETIRCAAHYLNRVVPGNGIVTVEYIHSLLSSPVETDDIFKYIYSSLGFSIDQLMEFDDDDIMDEMYATILSSTFYLGVFIDRYFFTPFGFYLKFINPGYLLPCSLEKEMAFAMEATDETADLSVAMFSPCSHYTLTRLGAEYFGVSKQTADPFVLEDDSQLESFIDTLSSGVPIYVAAGMFESFFVHSDPQFCNQNVYEVKVRLADYKQFWKKLELLEEHTLNNLYLEVCTEFDFDINMNYSFFRDMSESPFTEYRSPISKKQGGNTADITFKELELPLKHKFLLVINDIASHYHPEGPFNPRKHVKLELEVVKIKDMDINSIYPRVKSAGQSFLSLDMDEPF